VATGELGFDEILYGRCSVGPAVLRVQEELYIGDALITVDQDEGMRLDSGESAGRSIHGRDISPTWY
jgi:hypothetical protein